MDIQFLRSDPYVQGLFQQIWNHYQADGCPNWLTWKLITKDMDEVHFFTLRDVGCLERRNTAIFWNLTEKGWKCMNDVVFQNPSHPARPPLVENRLIR